MNQPSLNLRRIITSIFLLVCYLFVFTSALRAQEDMTRYVNPFIGTGGHGHTFPGATVPFGMVQLSPDTRIDGSWDGCSGYHESDSLIYGFSHTHLSGTGCSDYGDIMLMPMMGKLSFEPKIYGSHFSHQQEKATPGYYSVKLLDDDIDVELTVTKRVGLHKYTFNKEGNATFIVDLNHRDKLLAGVIKVIDAKTIEVYRCSQAWAKSQKLYARIEFSKMWLETKSPDEASIVKKDPWDRNIKSAFVFHVNKGEVIYAKVSLSPTEMKSCLKNGQAELKGWDFEKVRAEASDAWRKELGKIEVIEPDVTAKTIFYTALYHSMIHPSIYMDVDSLYRGMDDQLYTAKEHSHYTVFSLWDTFRALHPLFTIIDQKRTADFIKTFLADYDHGGRLPVWELSANETDCMIGYHSASVISDAYAKGIRNFDADKAMTAMKKSAEWKHLGLPAYRDHGYLSLEDESENVSKTLEYAYDDWCIATMANSMNRPVESEAFTIRSQHWRNVFNPATGFMTPKENGKWLPFFDPFRVDNNFTEANSWQYSLFVPQDINGLIEAMGGAVKFEAKLDDLFKASSKTSGREQADISGLIGQYAHGNEPSHNIAYLYNYIGKPWKTQEKIHQICTEFYKNSADGLIGNEDCGQMSAWFVLSAMGFYPVTPGLPVYQIGTPHLYDVKIHLENGRVFEIKTKNLSPENYYIQSARLNGTDYPRSWLEHSAIMDGGVLELTMGKDKNLGFGSESSNLFVNASPEVPLVPVPLIIAQGKTFSDSTLVEMASVVPGCTIYYTMDRTKPTVNSMKYTAPVRTDSNTVFRAIAQDEKGNVSYASEAKIYKITHPEWKVKIKSMYNPQYTAGGDKGIIDGLRGDTDWRKGGWQGFQAQDFEAVVDLGGDCVFSKVGAGFLQDSRSWILFPKSVEFESSNDGITYIPIASITNTVADTDQNVQVKDFTKQIQTIRAKYLRIKATNYGTLPSWHQGYGGEAFIFIDEILVE